MSANDLESSDAAIKTIKAVRKRDSLVVVSKTYRGFNLFMSAKCKSSLSFENFEPQFEAQVNNFNAHFDASKLPECYLVFLLFDDLNLENSQRVSVPAGNLSKVED